MFVGATKLSVAHQLRATMEMKYEEGKNLLVFIEELKQGLSKVENMGLPLQASLKPYILLMKARSLSLTSWWSYWRRLEQLQDRKVEDKEQGESALVVKGKKRGNDRSLNNKR
ncbi:hypothetical protein PHMEG_0006705 [Phytophthora megakarya]|uniref:Uncharacterized protein n=1 Tax=Phytophthora megakarya TaxID=4795 RepID=A0A225WNJ2_9STRA|nr:hypothetical protein PHMEG_0006705 [Phytophthora megakarya]